MKQYIRIALALAKLYFLGWLIYHFYTIQRVCFVWHSDAEMAAHQFTTGQIVGEIWAAAYLVTFWILCWSD